MKFQGHFRDVSRVFEGCFKKASMCWKKVSVLFQAGFKGITRKDLYQVFLGVYLCQRWIVAFKGII